MVVSRGSSVAFLRSFVYFKMQDTKPGLETGKEKMGFPRPHHPRRGPPPPPSPHKPTHVAPRAHAAAAPAALRVRISLAHSRRPSPHHPTTPGPAATSVARRRVALSWGHRYRPPLRTMSHRGHPEAVEAVSPAAVTWQSARYVRYRATLAPEQMLPHRVTPALAHLDVMRSPRRRDGPQLLRQIVHGMTPRVTTLETT